MKAPRNHKSGFPFLFCLFFCCIGLFAQSTNDNVTSKVANPNADSLYQQGIEAYQNGAFELAIAFWNDAAVSYRLTARTENEIKALLRIGYAYNVLGHRKHAVANLLKALDLAEEADSQILIMSVKSYLGNVYSYTGELAEARQLMIGGLELARTLNKPKAVVENLINIGILDSIEERSNNAHKNFKEAQQISQTLEIQIFSAKAFFNTALTAFNNKSYKYAKDFNTKALAALDPVDSKHDKALLLNHIGKLFQRLATVTPSIDKTMLTQSYNVYKQANGIGISIDSQHIRSYALGNIAYLYELEGNFQSALQKTRQAVFVAQSINDSESLYQWQWQTGRLLAKLGESDDAITAYSSAIDTLGVIRHDLSLNYRVRARGQTFRELTGALYFEFADLLLRLSDTVQDQNTVQDYLTQARTVVELLKTAEIEDYLRDDCVNIAQTKIQSIENIATDIAVIYIIPLPDRTELLVSLSGKLHRVTASVIDSELEDEVQTFRYGLQKRPMHGYLKPAIRLYDWLIRPLESLFESSSISTLVFVPDGALRTISFAALHDGQNFFDQQVCDRRISWTHAHGTDACGGGENKIAEQRYLRIGARIRSLKICNARNR